MALTKSFFALFLVLFLTGISFADVARVSGTLVTLTSIVRSIAPIVTMTCLILSALLFGVCNLSMGAEIRKQFVMMAQGLISISAVSAIAFVTVPPVVGTIYGLPPESCVYGCSTSCNSVSNLCCPPNRPQFCVSGTGGACKLAGSC
jgi:hypothetical protein